MPKYTEDELNILKEGGKRLAGILNFLGEKCVEGVSGKEIDAMAEKMILDNGDIPVFKNYKPYGAAYPFPATICISTNDVVAHGIPNDIPFKNGDVISLDLGLRHNGLVVDSAVTVLVGDDEVRKGEAISAEQKLLEVTKRALEIGIEVCRPGNRVNDIGIAIEKYVKENGFTVVDILCGHAVGREIHADPQIPHADFGPGGEKIKVGMVLAIEPHISMGNGEIALDKKDMWAYRAVDKTKSAQFEHTIYIGPEENLILTK